MSAREKAYIELDSLLLTYAQDKNAGLDVSEEIEDFLDTIVQAAVDQVRAELLDHRQKGDEIAKHHRETAFAYSVSDRVAYAVNKFIEKGVKK